MINFDLFAPPNAVCERDTPGSTCRPISPLMFKLLMEKTADSTLFFIEYLIQTKVKFRVVVVQKIIVKHVVIYVFFKIRKYHWYYTCLTLFFIFTETILIVIVLDVGQDIKRQKSRVKRIFFPIKILLLNSSLFNFEWVSHSIFQGFFKFFSNFTFSRSITASDQRKVLKEKKLPKKCLQ